jgi:hypothetical protein
VWVTLVGVGVLVAPPPPQLDNVAPARPIRAVQRIMDGTRRTFAFLRGARRRTPLTNTNVDDVNSKLRSAAEVVV